MEELRPGPTTTRERLAEWKEEASEGAARDSGRAAEAPALRVAERGGIYGKRRDEDP